MTFILFFSDRPVVFSWSNDCFQDHSQMNAEEDDGEDTMREVVLAPESETEARN